MQIDVECVNLALDDRRPSFYVVSDSDVGVQSLIVVCAWFDVGDRDSAVSGEEQRQ